jgi:hypothetical protein
MTFLLSQLITEFQKKIGWRLEPANGFAAADKGLSDPLLQPIGYKWILPLGSKAELRGYQHDLAVRMAILAKLLGLPGLTQGEGFLHVNFDLSRDDERRDFGELIASRLLAMHHRSHAARLGLLR